MFSSLTALGRLGTVDDTADTLLFLISDGRPSGTGVAAGLVRSTPGTEVSP